jgi:predicted alpha/beta superfamily hydrolase
MMLGLGGGCGAPGDGSVDAAASDAPPAADASDADGADARMGTLTTIRVVYPDGARVTIRGSGGPLTWDIGASTLPDGSSGYVLQTTDITEPVEWKPLLDDATWSRGPNYHVEPGQTVEISPRFSETAGRVITLLDSWRPSALDEARPVWAYLPPAHEANAAARFPVVYAQDGQNLFDPASAFGGTEWQVDEAMDFAAELGRCPDGTACSDDGACGGGRCDTFREAIVIGVGSSPRRIDEYTPTRDPDVGAGGLGDSYLSALVEELKPIVDGMLRTRPGPRDTALLGSSLGGLLAAYGGVTRADAFGLIGAMSPSTWWDDRMILGEVATIPGRADRAHLVYVDSGDSDDGATDTATLARAYEAAGFVRGADLRYVLAPGHAHREIYWRERLPGALSFLLGPRERPSD